MEGICCLSCFGSFSPASFACNDGGRVRVSGVCVNFFAYKFAYFILSLFGLMIICGLKQFIAFDY